MDRLLRELGMAMQLEAEYQEWDGRGIYHRKSWLLMYPRCRQCLTPTVVVMVTCGRSECQQAEYEANHLRNLPRPRRMRSAS